ncbi:phosphoglycerate dehydrogenase [Prolixibacter denitrificans]|uniref:D-3-phosphoglycerate dehydrogenase n=1 Tax=Prolixibacter denitrificans TaxID=1541063 RepID=A0A2P8C9R8_9BACT|nr:phosphoglycerate dehydrogenase [Prolixibacter denitrificans]PSK81702.1 D-3-phosphoglycerate dehydrogenase [Prolixibacter denitrificans]GET21225.1 D-3-phosphoglycerate dehydrogenase [Prolixibacter denitrificans]
MYKIQTLNKIDEKGLKLFPADAYEVGGEVTEPEGIVLRSFKMHDMELPSSLKAIARAGAGVNNIPIDKCTDKGIVVFNTPGANANAVKELVIAGMLLSSRNIAGGIEWAKTLKGEGNNVAPMVEKGKSNFAGNEIKGKTLAIIGLGAIGVMVANAAEALDMNVIGFDPYISVEHAWELNQNIARAESIEALLAQADYVTLQIPLMDKTKNFIDAEKIAMMKDGVRILNFARGGLVSNADLKPALESGKVGWYVTDFPDADVLNMKNVIAIPHLGASTQESETNCAVMAVREVRDYLENGNIRNSVNFPDVAMNRNGGARILIANKNVPNMVSQISTLLAGYGVNIADMMNRNRNGIAYNIIDIDRNELDPEVSDKLREIEGIFLVRVLPGQK